MKIFRFSEDGFIPKPQHISIYMLDFYLDPFNEEKLLAARRLVDDDCADWVRRNVTHCKEFAEVRYDDFLLGTWVFPEDSLDNWEGKYISSQLNHLDEESKKKRSWWSAEIDDDIEVYYPSCNMNKHLLTEISDFAVYIPARNLSSLRNIKPMDDIC